jgi:hypothetical protein
MIAERLGRIGPPQSRYSEGIQSYEGLDDRIEPKRRAKGVRRNVNLIMDEVLSRVLLIKPFAEIRGYTLPILAMQSRGQAKGELSVG